MIPKKDYNQKGTKVSKDRVDRPQHETNKGGIPTSGLCVNGMSASIKTSNSRVVDKFK